MGSRPLRRLIAVGDRSYEGVVVFKRGLLVFVGALAERDSGLAPHLCRF
jgi:hypothetical protein